MYAMKNIDGKESIVAKGVNIATEVNEFKYTLFSKRIATNKIRIQSKKHTIGTYKVNKMSLTCFDDKRYVWDDGIHTLADFHEDFKK